MTRLARFALCVVCLTLVFASFAVAQATGAPPAAPTQPPGFFALLSKMMPMFLMVFLIFYFLVLRPQQRRLNEHQKLLDSLKRGDTVVTSGGLFGRVASIEKESVLIEIASGVKVKVERAHVVKRSDKPAEAKTAA